jgi:hypothetical protein
MHATSLSPFSMPLALCKNVTTGRSFDEIEYKSGFYHSVLNLVFS